MAAAEGGYGPGLAQLHAMGFREDMPLVVALMVRYQGRLQRVINALSDRAEPAPAQGAVPDAPQEDTRLQGVDVPADDTEGDPCQESGDDTEGEAEDVSENEPGNEPTIESGDESGGEAEDHKGEDGSTEDDAGGEDAGGDGDLVDSAEPQMSVAR